MSDLKITHRDAIGTELVQTQESQGPMNPVAPFGQGGSIFVTTAATVKPPLNHVIVAITILDPATAFTSLIAEEPSRFINTETLTPAHYNTEGEGEAEISVETSESGTGGTVVSGTFPEGLTIYGRWTEIDLADGSCIAYIG